MNLEDLKNVIDNYFNDDVSRKGKKQKQVFMRWIYYRLAKKYFNKNSLEEIGGIIYKHHTCVLYGLKNFDYEYKTNESFRVNFNNCENIFKEIKTDQKLKKHKILEEIFKLPKVKIEEFEETIAKPFLLTVKELKNG